LRAVLGDLLAARVYQLTFGKSSNKASPGLRCHATAISPSVKYNPLETGCSEYGIEFVGCDRVPNLTKGWLMNFLLLWKHLKEAASS